MGKSGVAHGVRLSIRTEEKHSSYEALVSVFPDFHIAQASEELARIDSMLAYEREAKQDGWKRIAGVDEAGRGPLAGPIVAAAVILKHPVEGLNDSKQLSPVQREMLFTRLHEEGHEISVAIVSSEAIDIGGIQAANYAAMIESATKLNPAPDFLLVDGFAVPACPIPHRRLIKGDCLSLSIAAASVVAKVVRDRIMVQLHTLYPQYGFDRHKGYGTREHMAALSEYGPCPSHRKSFAPIAHAQVQGLFFENSAEVTV